MFKCLILLTVAVQWAMCQDVDPVPVVISAIDSSNPDFQTFVDDNNVFPQPLDNQPEWDNSQLNNQNMDTRQFVQPAAANFQFDNRRPPNNNNIINNNNVNAILPCGFSCSRRSSFLVTIDGTYSSVTCSDRNADVRSRCDSCCISRGQQVGVSKDWSSGFLSNNGECICCHMNRNCNGVFPQNPVVAAAVPWGNK